MAETASILTVSDMIFLATNVTKKLDHYNMDIPVMEIEGVIENDYKGIHIKKSVFIKKRFLWGSQCLHMRGNRFRRKRKVQ